MKRGYIVAEYIIVAFFFLMLFVSIVDQVVLVTTDELSIAEDHNACETAERLFRELVDNEDNVSRYGISGGLSTVNYNSIKYLYDNKNLADYNKDTSKLDHFILAYEIKGFDVQSAYSSKLSGLSTKLPRAQIWLNSTNLDNSSIVQNVIGIAAGGTVAATLKMTMVFPNATKLSNTTSSFAPTFTQESYGLVTTLYWPLTANSENILYISYTTDDAIRANWNTAWTRYGTNFQTINDIQIANNLIFIRDISYRNEELSKDYPIYLGNDTLAKAEWGAPEVYGCEYKRLYRFEANESFLSNQNIFSASREVNITRNFVGEVKIIST